MAADKKDKRGSRIPIRFFDSDRPDSSADSEPAEMERLDPDNDIIDLTSEFEAIEAGADPLKEIESDAEDSAGGPAIAELVATRSELKRIEAENAELKDRLARRQADFENYRKRVERERAETYNRVVADVALKLVGVLDNLKRALDAEASVEAAESDEFRHFLSGVDLIYKQLSGVLDAFGVQPIVAVGEPFNPHLHEAVATEVANDVEPDTVIQEIRTGYRLADKLIRPALVKVSVRG